MPTFFSSWPPERLRLAVGATIGVVLVVCGVVALAWRVTAVRPSAAAALSADRLSAAALALSRSLARSRSLACSPSLACSLALSLSLSRARTH